MMQVNQKATWERKPILSLQALRVIAFIMIFLNHSYDTQHVFTPDFGARGVETFFVLSGFLMMYHYWGNPSKPLKATFLGCCSLCWKKVKKFYLLHFLTFIFAAVWVIHALYKNGFPGMEVYWTIASAGLNLLLLQSWFNFSAWGFNGLSWFLSTILACYFVTPYVIRFFIRWHTRRRLLIAFSVLLLGKGLVDWYCAGLHQDSLGFFLYVNPLYRFWDYFAGCIAGVVFAECQTYQQVPSYRTASIWQGIMTMSFLAAIMFAGGGQNRYAGLPAMFILLNVSLIYALSWPGWIADRLTNRICIHWGDITLECYIIHILVLKYVGYAFYRLRPFLDLPHRVEWICAFGLTLLLAEGLHRWIPRVMRCISRQDKRII